MATAWFPIAVGALMLGQWAFFLLTGSVPELRTEPVRIGFHLAAEAATALMLIASGWAVLRGRRWGRPTLLVALGMLLYTAMVSPGYFAQQGQWPLVGMFGAVAVLALMAAVRLARS